MRLSITRAWDAFWNEAGYLGLHRLGVQSPHTDNQKLWIAAVEELQKGHLNITQVNAVTELLRHTVAITKERLKTNADL